MVVKFDELKVLKAAEDVADDLWNQIIGWASFEKGTVGKQLAWAADSVGANIAESYGRFHFGEKLQFLYYARGSLFETKYWLNRTAVRKLIPEMQVNKYSNDLSHLARQLNSFAKKTKAQKYQHKPSNIIREPADTYHIAETSHEYHFLIENGDLFSEEEIQSLQKTSKTAN